MANEARTPVVVIRRVKKTGDGHHGGAWKVAYADFVTAMMALFLVLWLMASDEKVKKAVGGYFQDPTGAGRQTGSAMAGLGEGLSVAKEELELLREKILKAMKDLPKFDQLKNHVSMTMTHEGLRIELMEGQDETFFENGSPQPTTAAREMIGLLAGQLKTLPNQLLIEGHTDAKPYASTTYSNWELSTDRANCARRLMMQQGLPEQQVAQVRGFAAGQLRDKKDPTNPSNRRISVLVKYVDGVAGAAPKSAADGH